MQRIRVSKYVGTPSRLADRRIARLGRQRSIDTPCELRLQLLAPLLAVLAYSAGVVHAAGAQETPVVQKVRSGKNRDGIILLLQPGTCLVRWAVVLLLPRPHREPQGRRRLVRLQLLQSFLPILRRGPPLGRRRRGAAGRARGARPVCRRGRGQALLCRQRIPPPPAHKLERRRAEFASLGLAMGHPHAERRLRRARPRGAGRLAGAQRRRGGQQRWQRRRRGSPAAAREAQGGGRRRVCLSPAASLGLRA
mmetsp:Transcript_24446/g.77407  ORF Transcript_24446/g.77407 Transcript_24446/m.77407 type:complete len:251 (-) Transcript_24446:106-858(-)